MFEEEHNLPFYEVLMFRKFKLNFFQHNNSMECIDEISVIGAGDTCHRPLVNYTDGFVGQNYATDYEGAILHTSVATMRGQIYLDNVNNVTIRNNTFIRNDGGPILGNVQEVGLLNN